MSSPQSVPDPRSVTTIRTGNWITYVHYPQALPGELLGHLEWAIDQHHRDTPADNRDGKGVVEFRLNLPLCHLSIDNNSYVAAPWYRYGAKYEETGELDDCGYMELYNMEADD